MFSHKHICLWAELLTRAAKEEPDPPSALFTQHRESAWALGSESTQISDQFEPLLRALYNVDRESSWSSVSIFLETPPMFQGFIHPHPNKKIRRTTGHPPIQNNSCQGPYRQTNRRARRLIIITTHAWSHRMSWLSWRKTVCVVHCTLELARTLNGHVHTASFRSDNCI